MAKDRKCLCCSTKYSYCPSCSGVDKLKPTWYSEFCSEECMKIWTTAVKYNLKQIDKQEAKSVIESLELKPKDKYVECVQRDLENILKEDIVEETTEEDFAFIEKAVVEPTVASTIETTVEQPVYYKKNKKNKKTHEVVTTEENI